jgi:hypothetical protein
MEMVLLLSPASLSKPSFSLPTVSYGIELSGFILPFVEKQSGDMTFLLFHFLLSLSSVRQEAVVDRIKKFGKLNLLGYGAKSVN